MCQALLFLDNSNSPYVLSVDYVSSTVLMALHKNSNSSYLLSTYYLHTQFQEPCRQQFHVWSKNETTLGPSRPTVAPI